MKQNLVLAGLKAGRPVVGPMLIIASPDLTEQVAHLGFDFVAFDAQHGEWTESTLSQALGRLRSFDTAALVRVRSHEPGAINWALDMGAQGVIVPMVENASEAEAIVRPAFFPPRGARSGGGNRLNLVAGGTSLDYFQNANDQTIVIAMVETPQAVAQAEAIMKVPGIGGVLIGPGDLMISVRSAGGGPDEHAALSRQVVACADRTGTPGGYVCLNWDEATKRLDQGFKFVICGTERVMAVNGMAIVAEQVGKWNRTRGAGGSA